MTSHGFGGNLTEWRGFAPKECNPMLRFRSASRCYNYRYPDSFALGFRAEMVYVKKL